MRRPFPRPLGRPRPQDGRAGGQRISEVYLLAGLAAAGVLVGVAIGTVGIGGVLLVPLLTLAFGFPVRSAIAVALMSYLPAGCVAVWLYARRGSIPWRAAGWICGAAVPTAYLGALVASRAPAALLEALIGLLLLAGGLHALRRREPAHAAVGRMTPAALAALGGITGFASAMTGAGGAFVLVPLLLLIADAPMLAAIGLGQAVQVPIAAVASLANLRAGLVQLLPALVLAAALALGIAVGTPIAHALPQQRLRVLLGVVVAAAGMLTLLKSAASLLAAL